MSYSQYQTNSITNIKVWKRSSWGGKFGLWGRDSQKPRFWPAVDLDQLSWWLPLGFGSHSVGTRFSCSILWRGPRNTYGKVFSSERRASRGPSAPKRHSRISRLLQSPLFPRRRAAGWFYLGLQLPSPVCKTGTGFPTSLMLGGWSDGWARAHKHSGDANERREEGLALFTAASPAAPPSGALGSREILHRPSHPLPRVCSLLFPQRLAWGRNEVTCFTALVHSIYRSILFFFSLHDFLKFFSFTNNAIVSRIEHAFGSHLFMPSQKVTIRWNFFIGES